MSRCAWEVLRAFFREAVRQGDAMVSIPTPDHYLPLLYVIALRGKGGETSFPVEGVDGGSISMLTVQIG